MKCHYCGAELKKNEVFCSCCGTRRMRQEQPAVQEKPAAAPVEFPEFRPEPTVMPEPAERMEPVAMRAPQNLNRPAYVPYGAPERKAPMIQLPTKRGLAKMFFLGILTLGIYPLVIWCRIVTELNIAASRYDGERTMSCFGAFALAPITLGIYPFVWVHGLCRRVGTELKRRALGYEFGASDFWLWNILGSLILVGPFIFLHKLMKSMNKINGDFNVNG